MWDVLPAFCTSPVDVAKVCMLYGVLLIEYLFSHSNLSLVSWEKL